MRIPQVDGYVVQLLLTTDRVYSFIGKGSNLHFAFFATKKKCLQNLLLLEMVVYFGLGRNILCIYVDCIDANERSRRGRNDITRFKEIACFSALIQNL